MPAFNLTPILFPKPKRDDVYDMLKDLLQIQEKQFAIEEGGEIYNPSSYDALIKEYEMIVNDPTISANDRRDAQKQLNSLMIKKLKTDLDRKKDMDAGDLKQMVQQDLRELEFEFPGNPIAYSVGAMTKYQDVLYGTAERNGLNQLIDILEHNYIDTTSLKEYQQQCLEELSKYSDIVDAYERGDMERLSEYAVIYTPYAGKVKAMRIIFRGDTDPSHSQPTNLRYSRDLAGNLAVVPDTGANGMQVYFVRANAIQGETYRFGNSDFTYGVVGWETKDTATFNYQNIKHAPLHSLPSGSFVKDSKDRLYYVNRDRSLFPVRNDAHKEELGFAEDKIYHLSPDEEINTLPGVIDHTKYPIMERYNREASMSDFNYWDTLKQEFYKELREPTFFEAMPEAARRAKRGARSLWEYVKKTWREAPGREPKPVEEKPRWGLEETKRTGFFEEAGKFIKKITP
ncbi:hypothetical protein KJA17_02360 [Patescibacteria group bacterium]|nr:hypothetical protein [Patescibacteria group bacterium]